MFWKKISPANGYCLFFPHRRAGSRFVSGQSVRVSPLEEWKHVRLGFFQVVLPGQDQLLVTTSEQLTCGIRASFGMLIGGPEEGREDRIAKATISCPAKRSLDDGDKVELVPFFQDWAKKHCQTAIVNTIKERKYIALIEDPEYRQEAEKKIESFARDSLATIGMMLVQCTVIVEPNEPIGVFATEEILRKWQQYRRIVNAAEILKLKEENQKNEEMSKVNADHEKENARLKQKTTIELLDLQQEKIRADNARDIKTQEELDEKDKQIGVIKEGMALRAQEVQKQDIRREEELKQERELKANELVELRRKHASESLAYHQNQLANERIVAEKELEVQLLKQKLNEVEVELERSRGDVKALNIQKEVLAKGAHEIKKRELLYAILPKIAEEASRPVAKIGEIRAINLSGQAGAEASNQSNIGSILASASTLPIVREIFRFVSDMEKTDSQEESKKPETA